MISRTLSEAMVSAIFPAFGVPRASDSANFAACLTVILGGIGGSFGSTTASISAGPGVASAWRRISPQVAGSSIVKPVSAATPGHGRQVDRLQFAGVFRIAQKHHLLPLDLAERVVLDDDDLDVEVVFHRRRELAHQHREPAVADEGDHLPARIGDCAAIGVREPAGHRGEVARAREHHVPAHVDVPRHPGRDGAGVGGDDGVVRQELVQARAPPPAASSAYPSGCRAPASARASPAWRPGPSPGTSGPADGRDAAAAPGARGPSRRRAPRPPGSAGRCAWGQARSGRSCAFPGFG